MPLNFYVVAAMYAVFATVTFYEVLKCKGGHHNALYDIAGALCCLIWPVMVILGLAQAAYEQVRRWA